MYFPAGSERFAEALTYVERHKLYSEAMKVWGDTSEESSALCGLYGDYLFDRREFAGAGLGEELSLFGALRFLPSPTEDINPTRLIR